MKPRVFFRRVIAIYMPGIAVGQVLRVRRQQPDYEDAPFVRYQVSKFRPAIEIKLTLLFALSAFQLATFPKFVFVHFRATFFEGAAHCPQRRLHHFLQDGRCVGRPREICFG